VASSAGSYWGVLAVASQAAPAGSHSRALKRSGVDRALALIGTLLVGGLVALQPPANAALANRVGDIGSALVSLAISLVIVAVLLLAFGDPSRLGGLHGFKPEYALGGIAGAAVVTVSLITVRPLGAAGVTAALVTAQLIVSVVVDRAGVLGLHEVAITGRRVLGVVLVIGGTYVITRP
jgi:transporter family-2 protein